MASDYGDEAGGKLLDWMLRIGQEAGAEAMARSARELSERLAGIRGTIAGGRAEAIAADGAPTYAKLSLEELSGLPEYATIKEIVSDRLRAASVEHHILPGEVDGRGHHVEVLRRRVGDLLHGRAAVEQLDRCAPLGGSPVVEAEEVGCRRLRVEVDEQGPEAPGGEDGGGLPSRGASVRNGTAFPAPLAADMRTGPPAAMWLSMRNGYGAARHVR